MNYSYDDDTLRHINESVNLIEYASVTLDLKRNGDEYFAHCPKHTDKTPSLSFTPEKNLYYCFSCGRSGGIINYLMDYENMCFKDAVKKAAQLADIDLSGICQSQTITFLKKIKSMNESKRMPYQHPILDEQVLLRYTKEPAQEWIAEGLCENVMDEFDIRIDTGQSRIIYPVRDIDGNLINIKGRTRHKNFKALHIPKYINYFPVGVMDYFQSLNITLPYIKQQNEIIVFESIKSTMLAYGWGFKNCVSAEKHTLTPEQVALLLKLRVNVVLAYDSDVDYWGKDVRRSIDRLKRITNVFLIQDKKHLLGGKESKNSPVDLGREIWEQLYATKQKVV